MEVVVHCALLTLFGILILGALPRNATSSRRDLQDLTQEANLALAQIQQELTNSAASAVRFESSSGLLMPVGYQHRSEAFAHTEKGEVVWYGWAVYALENGRLSRYFLPFEAPRSISGLGDPPASVSGLQAEVVGRNISHFEAKVIGPGLWQVGLGVESGDSRVDLETVGRPRN